MLEFVLFFATGLLLVVGLAANFENDLRSRAAALSIANEALRAWQISGDSSQVERAAFEAAKVFVLEPKTWSVTFVAECSLASYSDDSARVTVKVRDVTEIAQGGC